MATNVESQIVPGCHSESWGLCLISKGAPSKSLIAKIDAPGAIEGPPSLVEGRICSVSSKPSLQKSCSHFVPRTQLDNSRNEQI